MTNEAIKTEWSPLCPTSAGVYEVKESADFYQPVDSEVAKLGSVNNYGEVTIYEHSQELWVDDPDVGRWPLKMYHDGLHKPEWLKKRSIFDADRSSTPSVI